MVADVVETKRAGLVDQDAEQPAAAWQVADDAVGLLVDAAREEAVELAALVVEDAQRGVAGARELRGGLQQAVQDGLEVELGQQPAPGLDEPRKPALVVAFDP